MSKRTERNKRRDREIERVEVPIFIPTEDGQSGDIVLGFGEVRGSSLILNFNDLIPAQAIKHRIERGGLVGLTFIIPAEENEQHKANEDAIQAQQDAMRARREELKEQGLTDEEIGEILMSEKDKADLAALNTDDVAPEDLGN